MSKKATRAPEAKAAKAPKPPGGKTTVELVKEKAKAKAAEDKEKKEAQKLAAKTKRDAEKAEKEEKTAKIAEVQVKRGQAMILAAEKGRAMTSEVTDVAYINNLQKAVGKKFSVSATGLTLTPDAIISEDEFTSVIAGLAGATEGLRRAEGSTTFALGDACLEAQKAFQDSAENIITNAANVAGREKHTIVQAMRVCEFFPITERVEGLTFTHHQEGMNYSRQKGTDKLKITKPTLNKMLKDAFVVEGLPITKATGDDIEARKEPMSVRAFREILQDRVGKAPTRGGSNGDKKDSIEDELDHLFLYIDSDGKVEFTRGINLEICKADNHVVVDATDLTVLKNDGSIYYKVEELPAEEKKEEPVEAAEPKGSKKAKVGLPD